MDFTAFTSFAECLEEPVIIIDAKDGRILWGSDKFKQLAARHIRLGAKVERTYSDTPRYAEKRGNIRGTTASLVRIPLLKLEGWNGVLRGYDWEWKGQPVTTVVLKEAETSHQAAQKRRDALGRLSAAPEISSGDFSAACRVITEIGAKTMGISRVAIWLIDEKNRKVVNEVVYNTLPGEHTHVPPYDLDLYPHYIRMLHKERNILIPDTAIDKLLPGMSSDLFFDNIRAVMDCPIRVGQKLVGIVCADCANEPHDWTSEEQAFGASLADFVTIALESRRANEIERLMDNLVENLPDTAFRCVFENDSATMEYLSQGCVKLTGYPAEELINNNALGFHNLVHPEDLPALMARRQTERTDRQFDATFRIRHKNGDVRWIWERSHIVEVRKDNPLGFVVEGFFSDVTEKRQREDAERASRTKSEFLAQVSNEIRTPINAIIGIAEILLHDESLAGWHRKYISDIKVSSDSLLAVINDILDLTRLETGKLTLVPVSYDFRQMLENACLLVMYLANEKNLKFHYETEGDIPACLYGDDVRLRQVLLHILANAVKFTHEGSVSLHVVSGVGCLRFRVVDTGVGIRKEDVANLFEPFARFDPVKNRMNHGVGIGLTICKNIVDLMGGAIEVESEYGKSSTFTVTVPKIVGDEQSLAEVKRQTEIIYDKSTRILVVDDNAINLHITSGLLETIHGLRCDLASSGPEAIEKANKNEYHIVFMDHLMPDMDGAETAARIRALGGHNRTVPIIALTGINDGKETLPAASMDDSLAKPILKTELDAILHRWLPERQRVGKRNSDGSVRIDEARFRDFLSRFSAIEDLDAAKGLGNAAEQRDAYESSLRLFRERVPSLAVQLRDLLTEGKLKDFSINLHSLKNTLVSIGADPLSQLALTLEKTASSGIPPSLSPFLSRLTRLAEALEGVLEKQGKESEGE